MMTIHKHDNQGLLDNVGNYLFSSYVSASILNVSGDNTTYTVILGSEHFETGGVYNTSTGVFTASIDGLYLLGGLFYLSGLTASHTVGVLWLDTTARNYIINIGNYGAIRDSNGNYAVTFVVPVVLTAGQTASMRVDVRNGAKVVDVVGTAAGSYTNFWGILLPKS
jgi:hypothetical protein